MLRQGIKGGMGGAVTHGSGRCVIVGGSGRFRRSSGRNRPRWAAPGTPTLWTWTAAARLKPPRPRAGPPVTTAGSTLATEPAQGYKGALDEHRSDLGRQPHRRAAQLLRRPHRPEVARRGPADREERQGVDAYVIDGHEPTRSRSGCSRRRHSAAERSARPRRYSFDEISRPPSTRTRASPSRTRTASAAS